MNGNQDDNNGFSMSSPLSWFEFPRNNGHNFLWIISFLITQLSAFGIPIKQTFVPLFDIYFWNALKIF